MTQEIFRGCIPALMTPCDSEGTPNFDRLVETATSLIDAGMHAVVYAGSMGEWPLLSTEDRKRGVKALAGAGIDVIVGTGAQNPKEAAKLAAHAAEVGAKGIMAIPRLLSRSSVEPAQEAHFRDILKSGLPTVIYNSPYYTYQTREGLFFRLQQEFSNLVGFKEFGGVAGLDYAAEHLTSKSGADLIVGVDTCVLHGYRYCGAVGAITGIGNVLPKQILELIRLCELAAKGDSEAAERARQLEDALRVLAKFDEGENLVLYYKYLMGLAGHKGYEYAADPTDKLKESHMGYAQRAYETFLAFWENWSGD